MEILGFFVLAAIIWCGILIGMSPSKKEHEWKEEARGKAEKTTWEADARERALQNFMNANPDMPWAEVCEKFNKEKTKTPEEKRYGQDAPMAILEIEEFLKKGSEKKSFIRGHVASLITSEYVSHATDQDFRIIMRTFRNPYSIPEEEWMPQIQKIKILKEKITRGWFSSPQEICKEDREDVKEFEIVLARQFEYKNKIIAPNSEEAVKFYSAIKAEIKKSTESDLQPIS